MPAKVQIFCDFDGVLNVSEKKQGFSSFHISTSSDLLENPSPVRFFDDTVAAFRSIITQENVDFHWLTTWNDNGSILSPAAELGLPASFAVQPHFNLDAENKKEWMEWKFEHLSKSVSPDCATIWIDDNLTVWRPEAEELLKDTPHLFIQPDDGLSVQNLSEIKDFIESL